MPPASSRWSTGSSTTPRSSPSKANPTGSRKPAKAPTHTPDSAAKPSLEQAAAKSRRAIAGDIPSPTTILWFDHDDHPVVPTCTCPSRRAQWPSRMPAGHRRRRRVASWTAASTTAPSPQAGGNNASELDAHQHPSTGERHQDAGFHRRYGLLAPEPIECSGEAEDAEEGLGGLLVAGRYRAPFFQACPEVFDQVPVVVDPRWAGDWCVGALGRDGRAGADVPDPLAEGVGGVAAVADHPARHVRQTVQQVRRHRQFMGLTGREREGNGTPATVRDHAGLGAVAATRAAERLTAVSLLAVGPPFSRPAAFWCARKFVPSRKVMPSATPRSCTSSSRRSQTPRWPQRMKVCAAFHQGPSSPGMARHLAPFWWRQRMASIVCRRLSCGTLQCGRTSLISGSNSAHSASLRT